MAKTVDGEEVIMIDFFCGAGGVSTACELAFGQDMDYAVNHDPAALLLHRTNFAKTKHFEEDAFKVDLTEYVGNKRVAILHASPVCTHFSKAKGGKPVSKQLRILSWAVYKHARKLKPDIITMENVEEILTWGPIDENGYPIKERKGEDYEKFIRAMKRLGYEVDWRILNAADYGAPTTRKRWYCIMRRDGKPIEWPEPTHSKNGENGLKKWEPCYKYLDLDDWGNSIFMRGPEYGNKLKPLADKTMARIAGGMERFVFNDKNPFIRPVDKDSFTTPFISQYHSFNSDRVRGQKVTDPLMTIDTNPRYALVMAFITKFYKTGFGQSMMEPLHTITTSPGHFGMVTVSMVSYDELMKNGIDEETARKCTFVSQFIIEYYGTGVGSSLNEPLHTIVTKDRFALITVMGNEYCIMDIFLRMLNAEELKRCQGFPVDYIIDHDYKWRKYPVKEQVARIGNSVSPPPMVAIFKKIAPHLIIGEWAPRLLLDTTQEQIRFAI